MTQKDLYRILGVSSTATPEEIRTAYRRLLKRYHPDLYRGDPTVGAANSRAIVEAYDLLIDAAARAEYDAELADAAPARHEHTPRRVTRSGDLEPRAVRVPIHRSWSPRRPPRPTSIPAQGEGPGHAATAPLSAAFVDEWRASALRERPKLVFPKKATKFLLIFFLIIAIVVVLAISIPYEHSFALNANSESGLNVYSEFCGATVDIPAGSSVVFSWQAQAAGMSGYPPPIPSIGVVTPSGTEFAPLVAWNGSSSFISEGGTYEFGINNCFSGIAIYSIDFSGQYSAPYV